MNRRKFFDQSIKATGAVAAVGLTACAAEDKPTDVVAQAGPFDHLKSMVDDMKPISNEERKQRIEKAQRLMVENKIDALYLESGSSMVYFTGIKWGRSERMMAAIIPAKGELAYVCPAFEEERLKERILFGNDLRVWQEHESPYKLVGSILKDNGISTGKIGVEETVRFFLFDGLRKELPQIQFVNAFPVAAGCRMIKSPTELALMKRANEITIEAYRAAIAVMKEGMSQYEFSGNISAAFKKLGVNGGASVMFGEWAAYPHGSQTAQSMKEGDIVLMDGGCDLHDYAADITRTTIYGKPTDRQVEIWNKVKESQTAAMAAVRPGVACGTIDDVGRKVIEDAGFGPGYKNFFHRLGHGIGMDGHEWPYLVKGNELPLQPGMCFSDEPGIYIYGEIGVRLEDCFYVTEDGGQLFTPQSISIEEPFGV
jgi:Xaa-Pro dipeptidase